MPAFDLAHEQGQEVVNHAWLDYIQSIYLKFLMIENISDEDMAPDLDLFFTRLGAFLVPLYSVLRFFSLNHFPSLLPIVTRFVSTPAPPVDRDFPPRATCPGR